MSLNFSALLHSTAISRFHPSGAGAWVSEPSAAKPPDAFGSIVDLARLKFDTSSADICDVCNTINFGRTNYCKGCLHRLPAFYAVCNDEAATPRRPLVLADRVSLTDFAAFVLVINLLVGIAELLPVQ